MWALYPVWQSFCRWLPLPHLLHHFSFHHLAMVSSATHSCLSALDTVSVFSSSRLRFCHSKLFLLFVVYSLWVSLDSILSSWTNFLISYFLSWCSFLLLFMDFFRSDSIPPHIIWISLLSGSFAQAFNLSNSSRYCCMSLFCLIVYIFACVQSCYR